LFEGPLDLLLFLIKKNDIDITDIPISKITEQYMQYIDMMKMLDLDVVGDFLVMAANLMQIKAKMLLPPDPSEEEEIDPREELVQKLSEYQKFKQIADELQLKEEFRRDLFARQVDEDERKKIKDDAREIYFETSLFDLISALTDALNKIPKDKAHEVIHEEFTVENKIHDVLHLLLEVDKVNIKSLFGKCRTRIEAVVTFMAILELIRLKEIKAIQEEAFSDIEIVRNKDNMIPTENMEKEFSGEESLNQDVEKELSEGITSNVDFEIRPEVEDAFQGEDNLNQDVLDQENVDGASAVEENSENSVSELPQDKGNDLDEVQNPDKNSEPKTEHDG